MSDTFVTSPPELATARLRLRALAVEDAPAVFQYAADPEVARYTLWPPHESEAFTRAFLRMFTQPVFLNWAITVRDEDAVVGMVFFHSLARHHRKAELAFNLARSHWGRGIVAEAAGAALAFAFGPLRLHRVEATCMPANRGARRVMEKCGLRHEGTMRRSHLGFDGAAHDMDLFAILAED